MWGSVLSWRYRRNSASDAHRYWVGFNPICANARRQAWISGSSDSLDRRSRTSAIEEPLRLPGHGAIRGLTVNDYGTRGQEWKVAPNRLIVLEPHP
jgi:hypothetical protein